MPHRVLIEARSPLVFPARKPGTQFSPSLAYVPGGVLWGAASRQLQRTALARFGNALPYRVGDQWVRVLPATAMSCKAHPGFKADDPNHHGLFDTLIDQLCWTLLRPAALTYFPHCPICPGPAKNEGGFYARDSGGQLRARRVSYQLLTRVAIDRQRGTASESQLYSPIAIAEVSAMDLEAPTCFMGWLWEADEATRGALALVTAVGGRTSSGLGQVHITVGSEERSDGTMVERLERFNRAFAGRWALFRDYLIPQAEPGWSPGEWQLFTVGLQSDAIVLEEEWQPTLLFTAAQLREETGLEAELVHAEVLSRVVGGWNVSWNRPKATALAARAGGLYLFRSQAPTTQIAEALNALEARGIGQRRQEGYGVVRCCDEFHVESIGGVL